MVNGMKLNHIFMRDGASRAGEEALIFHCAATTSGFKGMDLLKAYIYA